MNQTYNTGNYTSDDKNALRKDIIAEMVMLKTLDRIEFSDAVVMEGTDQLDHYLRFPKNQILPTFQIVEGSTAEYQKMGWFDMSFRLNKYRSKLMIDDESKVRYDEATQWAMSIDGVARGAADARDNEIMNTLYNAVGTDIS